MTSGGRGRGADGGAAKRARRSSRPAAPAAAPEWAFLGAKILEPLGPGGPRWVPAVTGLAGAVLLGWAFVMASQPAMSAAGGTPADVDVAAAVSTGRTVEITRLLWAITVLGNTSVAWACALGAIFTLVIWGYRTHAVLVAVTVGGGNALSALIKLLFERPRPQGIDALIAPPHSFSMPSGHVVYATLVAALILFAVVNAKRVSASAKSVMSGLALLWMMLMGVSRVYLGVHWASDAVAGWLLGGAWASACIGAWVSWRRGAKDEVHVPVLAPRQRTLFAATAIGVTVAVIWVSARATPLLAMKG